MITGMNPKLKYEWIPEYEQESLNPTTFIITGMTAIQDAEYQADISNTINFKLGRKATPQFNRQQQIEIRKRTIREHFVGVKNFQLPPDDEGNPGRIIEYSESPEDLILVLDALPPTAYDEFLEQIRDVSMLPLAKK